MILKNVKTSKFHTKEFRKNQEKFTQFHYLIKTIWYLLLSPQILNVGQIFEL